MPGLFFSSFLSFLHLTANCCSSSSWWLDSNPDPVFLDTTTLPTVPQPLPMKPFLYLRMSSRRFVAYKIKWTIVHIMLHFNWELNRSEDIIYIELGVSQTISVTRWLDFSAIGYLQQKVAQNHPIFSKNWFGSWFMKLNNPETLANCF